ncbi:HlyD family efflux transporter periplasmic adaptor subunit [bacterium SCSIO 12643]|nr:HlyD family efflux transporter periplasmic adaptor subunit [bacterium SCSIO 12643]
MDRTIENKNWLRIKHRGIWILGILGIGLTSIALIWDDSSALRVSRDQLTITTVLDSPFQEYINVRGRVEPKYMSYVDAVEGGIVEKIYLEEGAMVRKGDTLLILSNLNLSLNILNSEAQLAEKANFLRETQISMEQQKLSLERELLRLEFDLKQTERKYQQNQAFYKEQLISKEDFLASEEAYHLAIKLKNLSIERQKQDAVFRKTQIQKIEQNLQNMERNLALIYQRQEHLIVRASVDGQLAALNAVPGQSVIPGYRLGQINVLGNYKLQASIDEHYIDRIHKDLAAQLERQNENYALHVDKIYPEVREGRFLVDLVFDDAMPENIRSGQNYHLNIQLDDPRPALLVQRGAFFQSTGGRWIYVLDKDGQTASRQTIQVGKQNPKYYEILDGLHAGDQVVVSSYDLLGNNDKLEIE